MPSRAPSYMAAVVSVAATLWLLIQARTVLEPLVISMLIWFVLTATAGLFARWAGGQPSEAPPVWAHAAAAASALVVIFGLSIMVSNSLASFRANLPAYETNLQTMLSSMGDLFGMDGPLEVDRLVEKIEVQQVAVGIAGTALGFVSSLIVIIVYVLFLFTEAAMVRSKLRALAPDPDRFDVLAGTADKIRREIETYLGVKCVVGAAQAVPTFLVLAAVGVDGAAFWSVIIFVASFVPTIGTLIGIVFPAVVALVQFDTVTPFLVTTGLLAVIQLAGSNWLEPKLMGSSLNLSPLVILISIFAGGALWGITGALIAVPALSIAMIVFARIGSMRPVAVLLSSDGKV